MSSVILKVTVKAPYKVAKPGLQAALSRGGRHVMKTKKHIRVNEKISFRKEA